jgi:hypothetical protein
VLERQDASSSVGRRVVAKEAKNLADVAKESLTAGNQARGLVKAPSSKEIDAFATVTAPVGIVEAGPGYVAGKAAGAKAAAESAALAARGAKVGDEVVGGSKVARALGLKPSEVADTVENRAAAEAAKASGSGVRRAVSAARSGARGRAAAREVTGIVTRKEAAHAAGAPGIVAKATGAQILPVVKGHERALAHRKTYETTAREIPGLVTAPVGQAIGLGITGGRAISQGAHELGVPGARGYTGKQILEPAVHIGEEQLAFAKQVAKTLTSSDSAEVQKAVEDELGLMLPVILGLGGKAVADKVTKGRLLEATRQVVNNARTKVGHGHPTHNGQTPRLTEKTAQHKRESVRIARSNARTHREVHGRTRKVRREAGRAKGSETIRRGVTTPSRLTGRRGDLKVHAGDVINFAIRHSLPLDKPAEALAEVKRIGAGFKPLPEGFEAPADQISSRDLVGFIERNPAVLVDKHVAAEVQAGRDQAAHAREHAAELEPEHSETARYTSTAVTRGVPLKTERFPTSVRDITRAEPTPGRLAKDVLRRESRSDRVRAKRQNRKASTREARGRAIAAELKVRERSEPDWGKRNAAVKAKGDRFSNQARTYRDAAVKAAEQATRKHHAATEVDPAVEQEFLSDISGRLQAEGKPEPEYTHTGRAKGVSVSGTAGTKLVRFPGRSKRRAGTAEEYGMVQEGLAPYLRNSIAKPVTTRESFKAIRSFHAENDLRIGDKVDFTPDQVQRLVNEGKVDLKHYVALPSQEFKRAYDPAEYAATLATSLDRAEDPTAPRVRLVRRPAAEEFAHQLGHAVIAPKLSKINRATSYLILGTSPAWAAAQIVAEYAQGAAAQPKILNPLFVRRAIKAYKALPEEKRWAFDGYYGITARDLDTPGDLKGDKLTGNPGSASDAYSVWNRTPGGRAVRSIPRGLQRLDQWKGGGIRMLTVAAKIDHDLNLKGGSFLRGIRGLSDTIEAASKEMKGKPLDEQLAYVAGHPEIAEHTADYLDDVMGNWSALTKNEQLASKIAIFYPFIRMSLRWTFYSFPKRHPLKAAALTYLAQQNAVTLRKFLGRDPSYFSEWANVPVQLGPDKSEWLDVPLGRITPGGNTAVELGAEGSLKGLLLKSAQPALVAAIEAETGVNPMTLAQEPDSLLGAASQLWSLPGVVRTADEFVNLPAGRKRSKNAPPIFGSTERQEALDKLFDKLGEAGTASKAVRTVGMPLLPKKGEYVTDLVKLRAVLKTLSDNSSSKRQDIETAWAYKHQGGDKAEIDKTLSAMEAKYERGDKALSALLDKYKIPHVAEEEAGGQRYDEIHYHSKPGKGTTSFGAASVKLPTKHAASTGGASTFGGKTAPGPVAKPVKEPRFRSKTPSVSTFGGKPAR